MEKSVMVVGLDESEHSIYALQWTLQHFFSPPENSLFKLVIVHAKPPPSAAVSFTGPSAAAVVTCVANDLRLSAARVMEKAKEICASKSIKDAICEVVNGDPRNVLCQAVEKHHASLLVVGSHGYGAIKRAVLGSVSDYCNHHAHCSVMVVKRPKIKH